MNSFQIIGDSQSLDVVTGSKLVTEFVANTFNDASVFAGSYSYPISFPFTAKNIAFFGHAHHLENRQSRGSKEVTVVLFGLTWKQAKLDYSIKGNVYSGNLKIDSGSVATSMRDMKLVDIFTSQNNGMLTYKSIALGETQGEVVDNMLSYPAMSSHCWPTVVNPFFTGVELLKTQDNYYINHFANMSAVENTRLFTPMLNWVWLIKEVCNWLGYTAQGSYLDDPFINSLIVYNTGARTGLDWKESKEIKIAQHLPDLTISELMKALRNDHRVIIYFDSLTKVVRFEKSGITLAGLDRVDLKKGIHQGSIEIDPISDTAYKLITKVDDTDQLYSTSPYEKSVLVGYNTSQWKELPLSIGTVFMQKNEHFTIANFATPYAYQIGNVYSEQYNTEDNKQIYNGGNVISKNPFALRLLSYKGLQVVRESPRYRIPFASSNRLGPGTISYNQTLDHGGAGGLLYTYSLPWYRFICLSEKVSLKSEMSVTQFFNLNPLQKIEICGVNQASVEALVDKIVFEPKSVGNTLLAKITCYPNYIIPGGTGNLKVLVGSSTIENLDGTVYVKLFMKHIRSANEGNNRVDYQEMWLEFYSDPAGLMPKEVNDLAIVIVQKQVRGTQREHIATTPINITANGIKSNVGEYKYWENLRGPIYATDFYSYNIDAQNGQISLGDYKWNGRDPWVPQEVY